MGLTISDSNMSKSANQIEVYKGQSKDLVLETVKDEVVDGKSVENPLDLTGASLYLMVKRKPGDPEALISKSTQSALEIQIKMPPILGIAYVYFVPSDTAALPAGDYVFDLWMQQGSKRAPLVEVSPFVVLEPVTVL